MSESGVEMKSISLPRKAEIKKGARILRDWELLEHALLVAHDPAWTTAPPTEPGVYWAWTASRTVRRLLIPDGENRLAAAERVAYFAGLGALWLRETPDVMGKLQDLADRIYTAEAMRKEVEVYNAEK